MPNDRQYFTKDLLELGITITRETLLVCDNLWKDSPETALKERWDRAKKKRSLIGDEMAEQAFAQKLKTYHGGHYKDIGFYGEEKLGSTIIDLKDKRGTFVLVDAIDGSDLYERGLSNWCTAATFFTPTNPPGSKIRVAIVALPTGEIYYSTDEDDATYVHRPSETSELWKQSSEKSPVRGPSKVNKMSDATICFYGQKPKNLIASTLVYPSTKNQDEINNLFFRAYNLGGIPMIMKLIDHYAPTENTQGIDVVFDILGQQPHDIVPGAYLALKAKVPVFNLASGVRMNLTDLENGLLRPNDKSLNFKYIVASTDELAEAFQPILNRSFLGEGVSELVRSSD